MFEFLPFYAMTLTFLVPILVILLKSQVGKAFVRYLDAKSKAAESISVENIVKTEQLFMGLDNRVRELESTVRHLKESDDEYRKLLKR